MDIGFYQKPLFGTSRIDRVFHWDMDSPVYLFGDLQFGIGNQNVILERNTSKSTKGFAHFCMDYLFGFLTNQCKNVQKVVLSVL